jgi:hypothetical protein
MSKTRRAEELRKQKEDGLVVIIIRVTRSQG